VSYNGAPLRFRLPVPAGGRMTLVSGSAKAGTKEAGKRPLILNAEGAASQTVDPVKDFGANSRLLSHESGRCKSGRLYRYQRRHAGWIAGPQRHSECALGLSKMPCPTTKRCSLSPWRICFPLLCPRRMPERRVVVLVTMQNETSDELVCRPTMHIASTTPVTFSAKGGRRFDRRWRHEIDGDRGIAACEIKSNADATVTLPPVTLAANATAQTAFTIDRHRTETGSALSVAQAIALRDSARDWWEKLDLPYNTIQIPDAGIQQMIESSVRNILAGARDHPRKDRLPRRARPIIAACGSWTDLSYWKRPRFSTAARTPGPASNTC